MNEATLKRVVLEYKNGLVVPRASYRQIGRIEKAVKNAFTNSEVVAVKVEEWAMGKWNEVQFHRRKEVIA